MNKKYQTYILCGAAVIIGLIGGFFWGKHVSASSVRAGFAGATGFSSSTRARFGGAGGAAGAGLATGQITSIDSQSITLQLANGNSQVIFYSSSTAVTEPTVVPVTDLKSGSNVIISGTPNSDGSLTANSIQVRPTGARGGPSATGQ